MKLFDRITKKDRKKVLKCPSVFYLKEKESLFSMPLIDVLIVWESIYPEKEFNINQFKQLFK